MMTVDEAMKRVGERQAPATDEAQARLIRYAEGLGPSAPVEGWAWRVASGGLVQTPH